MEYCGCIIVEDASGARFQVYKYKARRLFMPSNYYVLDTGEPLKHRGAGNFVIAATGETLVKVG